MWHELNIVRKQIPIHSSASKVFAAWTEPDHIARWFTDDVTGWPGVGGDLTFHFKNFGFSVEYKLAEMRPDTKVIYKTRLPGVGTQVLTINLARRAPKTIVHLAESGPENHKTDPKESGVDSGWDMSLGLLKYYVEKQFAKDRETFFAMLPAQFEFPAVHRLFTTPEGIGQWTTLESDPPKAMGDSIKLRFDSGMTLTGKILALTHHEMSTSWEEIDGYLELKSFPTGGDNKGLCLRGGTYAPAKNDRDELEALIKDTLVKLFAAVSSG